MVKKTGDLLGVGLILISISLLTMIFGLIESIGSVLGVIGAVVIILVEGMFLIEKWLK
jgi:hypothetical protein